MHTKLKTKNIRRQAIEKHPDNGYELTAGQMLNPIRIKADKMFYNKG